MTPAEQRAQDLERARIDAIADMLLEHHFTQREASRFFSLISEVYSARVNRVLEAGKMRGLSN